MAKSCTAIAPIEMPAAPLGHPWRLFAVLSCCLAGQIAGAAVIITEDRVAQLEQQLGQTIGELQRLSVSERNLIGEVQRLNTLPQQPPPPQPQPNRPPGSLSQYGIDTRR